MLVKQWLVQFFKDAGIDTIFHLPGIHTLPLNAAFGNEDLRLFMVRHESSCAFMADGFSRTSAKAGVVLVTPGPGLGNVISGTMEAYGSDSPLLIVHVDTGREEIGKGILHELEEPEAIFRTITKAAFAASRPGDLPLLLGQALKEALTPRQGPVLISIPYTFFEKDIPVPTPTAPAGESQQTGIDEDRLRHALRGKERPLIVGGKALMFEGVANLLDGICLGSSIPFLTSTAGKGIVPETEPYAFGNVMQKGLVREMAAQSDCVIALGTRLRDVDARRRGVKIGELVHIDIDDRWMGKNYPTPHSASAQMAGALQSLAAVTEGKRYAWDLAGLKERQHAEAASLLRLSPGMATVQAIRRAIPEDTTTVWDLSLPGYWAEYHFPVSRQRSFIMARGTSPIFFGLPAAIGARLGRPDRPCLSVCGDGGVLPCLADLATMAGHHIPVVLLIYNNGAYGILADAMETSYGIAGAMTLTNPDFVRLARSFGIKARRVRSVAQLERVLRGETSWTEPFVIDFTFPAFPPPWRV
jgi:thiamine pyrophosphate-dependent acetolactate synthase large subunit-like protein